MRGELWDVRDVRDVRGVHEARWVRAPNALLCALIAALFCTVGASVACVERPAPLEPVKIGVLYPKSGGLASLGPAWADATRLAAEQVNAGGGVYGGRPLQLALEDSGTDPDTASARAQALIDDGVIGLVGPATSGEVTAVLPLAIDAQVPVISCCATSKSLTDQNQPNEGYFFRTTPSDELQGAALAYIARNGVAGAASANPCPHTAFLYRDDEYGAGFEAVYRAEYEGADIEGSALTGAMLLSQGFPPDAAQAALVASADTFVTAIDAALTTDVAHPELCIVVIGFDVDGGELVAQVDDRLSQLIDDRSAAGFALPYHFLVGDGANSSVFANRVGNIGARLVGTVPYHGTGEAYDQFKKAFQARFETDDEPIPFTSQNFDAVFLLALAATKAASDDGAEIKNALFDVSGARGGELMEGRFFGEIAARILDGKDVDYAGPSGALTFDAFGDVVGDYVLWQVGSDGAGGFVVVERQPLLASEFTAE